MRVFCVQLCRRAESLSLCGKQNGLYIWMMAWWVIYGVAGGELGYGYYDFA